MLVFQFTFRHTLLSHHPLLLYIPPYTHSFWNSIFVVFDNTGVGWGRDLQLCLESLCLSFCLCLLVSLLLSGFVEHRVVVPECQVVDMEVLEAANWLYVKATGDPCMTTFLNWELEAVEYLGSGLPGASLPVVSPQARLMWGRWEGRRQLMVWSSTEWMAASFVTLDSPWPNPLAGLCQEFSQCGLHW